MVYMTGHLLAAGAVIVLGALTACAPGRLVDRYGKPAQALPFPPVVAEFDGVAIRASSDRDERSFEEALVDGRAALEAVAHEVGTDLIHSVSDLVLVRLSKSPDVSGQILQPRPGTRDRYQMWIVHPDDLRLVAHEFAHILDRERWNGLDITSLPHVPSAFAGPDVLWSEPAALWPTRYSQLDVFEWFAEIYGSLFALANQLSGPLVRHSNVLDGPAFADIADRLAALDLLRQDSAAFVRRFVADPHLRAEVHALRGLILDAAPIPRLRPDVDTPRHLSPPPTDSAWSSKRNVGELSRSQWRMSTTTFGDGPVRLDALEDPDYRQTQGAARTVLFEVFAMTHLAPERLAGAANHLAASGRVDEARKLVDEALRRAANWLKHPDDPEARSSCDAFAASLPPMPGEQRYLFQLTDNHLDTNCFAGAAELLSGVDEELLGRDPKPRIRWLLTRIRPTEGFLRYVAF